MSAVGTAVVQIDREDQRQQAKANAQQAVQAQIAAIRTSRSVQGDCVKRR